MKALSFRQPWAELILQGRKTMDLRTYQTSHRGSLAVYAPKTIDQEACERYQIDPQTLQTGGVLGIVQVVDILPLDQESYAANQEAHLGGRSFRDPLYGWQLQDPQRLPAPIPATGRMSLFNVDLDLSPAPPQPSQPRQMAQQREIPVPAQMGRDPLPQTPERPEAPASPFLLTVEPGQSAATDYGLSLVQRGTEQPEKQGLYTRKLLAGTEIVVTLRGDNLRAVASYVIEAIRQSGYKATDLSGQRRKPFDLPEEAGVRLGLLFLAVKPLTKMTRVEAIAHGIRQMPLEEVYYWYSKCTAADSADRAQKALRVLLAEE
jgi:hypothetical protein